MAAERRGGDVPPLQQVAREDPDGPAHQRGGKGPVVGRPEGVVVQNLGLLHLEKVARIGGRRFGIDGHLVGVQDVMGSEGLSVVPSHPLSEVKGDHQAVPGDLPGFGQVAHDVDIFIVLDQPVENQPGDLMRGGVRGQQRDQVRGIADRAFDEDVSIGRFGDAAPRGDAPGRLRAASRDGQTEKNEPCSDGRARRFHARQATA